MVTRSERLTVGDQLDQSTVAVTCTISAIREMLCDVMRCCQSPVWRHRQLYEVNYVPGLKAAVCPIIF